MIFAAGLLLASPPAASLVAAERVELPAREVHLGEVATWQGPDGLGQVVIARIPQGRAAFLLSRQELASLVRRRVPGIQIGEISLGSILLVAPVKEVPAERRCLQLVIAKSAGEELLADDVTPASCPEPMPARALRFDAASGANIATRTLEAGSIIARAKLAEAPALRRGDKLRLASKVGPVTIERPVTLAQGARPNGRKVFVRTNDGEIIAAKIEAEGAQPE